MPPCQPAILAAPAKAGRFLVFGLQPGADPRAAVGRLAAARLGEATVVGLGQPLVEAIGARLPELRAFPAIAGAGVAFPSTQGALWAFVGGADSGESLHRARALRDLLGEAFRADEDVLAFEYAGGHDLSGYEDGTENPREEKAVAAAIVGDGALAGSSFVAVQRWVHDLGRLDRMTPGERDLMIGRRRDVNEEIADAPASAHVKRTAQESFDPPGFMVRRSMPWGNLGEHGLYFVAYVAALETYERTLRRMAGLEDGVVDALMRFTRAASGGYYWCPALRQGRLDLRPIGL
jgi:putative iron-dependent peroxidase